MISIKFWWKSIYKWRCRNTFSKIFGLSGSWFLVDDIAQKCIHKIYIIRRKTTIQFGYIYLSRVLCYYVFRKFSSISNSIAWNRTKYFMKYTFCKRWHWYSFFGHSLIGGAVVTFFPKISGSCRSCVLLNETTQKFIMASHFGIPFREVKNNVQQRIQNMSGRDYVIV